MQVKRKSIWHSGCSRGFAEYGVSVSYDAAAQEWTIDFGPTVSDALVAKRDVKFYIVIKDTAGQTSGAACMR